MWWQRTNRGYRKESKGISQSPAILFLTKGIINSYREQRFLVNRPVIVTNKWRWITTGLDGDHSEYSGTVVPHRMRMGWKNYGPPR